MSKFKKLEDFTVDQTLWLKVKVINNSDGEWGDPHISLSPDGLDEDITYTQSELLTMKFKKISKADKKNELAAQYIVLTKRKEEIEEMMQELDDQMK